MKRLLIVLALATATHTSAAAAPLSTSYPKLCPIGSWTFDGTCMSRSRAAAIASAAGDSLVDYQACYDDSDARRAGCVRLLVDGGAEIYTVEDTSCSPSLFLSPSSPTCYGGYTATYRGLRETVTYESKYGWSMLQTVVHQGPAYGSWVTLATSEQSSTATGHESSGLKVHNMSAALFDRSGNVLDIDNQEYSWIASGSGSGDCQTRGNVVEGDIDAAGAMAAWLCSLMIADTEIEIGGGIFPFKMKFQRSYCSDFEHMNQKVAVAAGNHAEASCQARNDQESDTDLTSPQSSWIDQNTSTASESSECPTVQATVEESWYQYDSDGDRWYCEGEVTYDCGTAMDGTCGCTRDVGAHVCVGA